MATELIPVEGLLTVHCARNVEAALKRLPGVHHVDANYLNSTATVHYDEQQVSLEKMRQTVRDCGYVCREEAAHPEPAHHDGHPETTAQAATMPHDHGSISMAAAPNEV